LDYEIYGNGVGSVRELVTGPTRELAAIFEEGGAKFVLFAEALEFAKMQDHGCPGLEEVASQLRQLRHAGHEIGLHLHPWWAGATLRDGSWVFNLSERNICTLPEPRADEIVNEAINYLRRALAEPSYAPFSYRGGLWLMQPSAPMSLILARHGVRVDSSVFKGGRTRELGLDYRRALRNGSYWPFEDDVNVPDPEGCLTEVPIHTLMVPFWRMLSGKRLAIQKRAPSTPSGSPLRSRWRDFARWRYPLKFDFCRMTLKELVGVVHRATRRSESPHEQRAPIVAIGHSKDLTDFATIRSFLRYLSSEGVPVTTFHRAFGPSALEGNQVRRGLAPPLGGAQQRKAAIGTAACTSAK
jgi:hypothetical protein